MPWSPAPAGAQSGEFQPIHKKTMPPAHTPETRMREVVLLVEKALGVEIIQSVF